MLSAGPVFNFRDQTTILQGQSMGFKRLGDGKRPAEHTGKGHDRRKYNEIQ
jgi:hypothetical protein